jgi:hypothetical protein
MKLRFLAFAAILAVGGCSTLTDYGVVRKEGLRNDQGHLIGYKELLRNEATGEVLAHVALFTPVHDGAGDVIGYEEQNRGGALIRDLSGRPIGSRFADLRSRSTNARNKGITIVIRPVDAPQVARAQPGKILQLMASLSTSDLRRVR